MHDSVPHSFLLQKVTASSRNACSSTTLPRQRPLICPPVLRHLPRTDGCCTCLHKCIICACSSMHQLQPTRADRNMALDICLWLPHHAHMARRYQRGLESVCILVAASMISRMISRMISCMISCMISRMISRMINRMHLGRCQCSVGRCRCAADALLARPRIAHSMMPVQCWCDVGAMPVRCWYNACNASALPVQCWCTPGAVLVHTRRAAGALSIVLCRG